MDGDGCVKNLINYGFDAHFAGLPPLFTLAPMLAGIRVFLTDRPLGY